MARSCLVALLLLWQAPGHCRDIPAADASSLQAALTRAGAEKALVALIAVRAEGGLDAELLAILRDQRVERALRRSVPLILSGERHPDLAARFGIRRFPVTVFIDGSGREAGRIAGLGDPAAFAERVEEIVAGVGAGAKAGSAAEEALVSELVLAAQASWNAGERFQAAALFERAVKAMESPAAGGGSGPQPLAAARAAARAHLGLADHLQGAGKTAEAVAHYRSALGEAARAESAPPAELSGLRARAAIGLALALRTAGRTAEAVAALEGAIDGGGGFKLEGGGRARAVYLLGSLLREQGEAALATERFAQCAREFPGGRYGERARRYLAAPAASAPRDQSALPASR